MHSDANIQELWSLRVNPSDLYNIERPRDVNPESGGGHTYIQVPTGQVESTLRFLNEAYPPNGVPLIIKVHDQTHPNLAPEQVEFWAKSAGRMRIAQQNRHRHARLTAWSPSRGFPELVSNATTDDARTLLNDIGGLHLYLARAENGVVWAGFTTGEPSVKESRLPFANILWGNSRGGYWIYQESNL